MITIVTWTIAAAAGGTWCALVEATARDGGLDGFSGEALAIIGRYATAGALFGLVTSVLDVMTRAICRNKPRRVRAILAVATLGAVAIFGLWGGQLQQPGPWGATAFAALTAAASVWCLTSVVAKRPRRLSLIYAILALGAATTLAVIDPNGLRGTYKSLDLTLLGAAIGCAAAAARLAMHRWGSLAVTVVAIVAIVAPRMPPSDDAALSLLIATSGRMEVLDRTLVEAGLWPARATDESIIQVDAATLLEPPTTSDDPRATWRERHGQAFPKNLILVTIDALRADATGLVDDRASHTPRLDALAKTGAAFPKAWSQAPATAGSMESFLTGRYPSRTPVASALRVGQVTEEAPGLATLARNQGFDTAWFTGLSDTTLPSVVWDRLKRGFDQVMASPNGPDAISQVDRGITWVRERSADKRWFLWMHLFDPHEPYESRDPNAGDDARSRYESEVRYADRALGKLLDALKSAGLDHKTVVVVHADHGEAFNEHGRYYHGTSFFQPQIHVPLVIAAPGIAAATHDCPIGNVDLAPTLVDLLGIPTAPTHLGRSVLPTLLDPTLHWPRFALAETLVIDRNLPWSQDRIRTITDGRFKLINYLDSNFHLLFDLRNDPGETRNLATERVDDARRLRGWLAALDARWAGTSPTKPAPPLTLESLRTRLTSSSPTERHAAFLELRNDPSVLTGIEDEVGSYDPGLAHTVLTLIEHFLAADLPGAGTPVPLGDRPSATRYRLMERYARSPRFRDLTLPPLPDNATAGERFAYQLALAARHDDDARTRVTRREPASRAEWGHLAPALGGSGTEHFDTVLQLLSTERRPDALFRMIPRLAPAEIVAFVLHGFPQPQRTMHARSVEKLLTLVEDLERPDAWLALIALHGSVGPASQRRIEASIRHKNDASPLIVVGASRLWTRARFEEPHDLTALRELVALLRPLAGPRTSLEPVEAELRRAELARDKGDPDDLVLTAIARVATHPGALAPGPPRFTFENRGQHPIIVGPGGLAYRTLRWQLDSGGATTAAAIRFPRGFVLPGKSLTLVVPIDYPRSSGTLAAEGTDVRYTVPPPPWTGPAIARLASATLPLVGLEQSTLFEVHSAGDAVVFPELPAGKHHLRIKLTIHPDKDGDVPVLLLGAGAPVPLGEVAAGKPTTLEHTVDLPAPAALRLRVARGPALVYLASIAVE